MGNNTVISFVYLEVLIDEYGYEDQEMREITVQGNRKCGSLKMKNLQADNKAYHYLWVLGCERIKRRYDRKILVNRSFRKDPNIILLATANRT